MVIEDKLKINTIYIISKGRPQCRTAQTLQQLNYPGKWYIVCGVNDERLNEYIQRWGKRVITFNWYEESKHTNYLDNFGLEDLPSGACPVRNAVRKISEKRGEIRHWQFDDDYMAFQRYNYHTGKNEHLTDGRVLFSAMYRIAEFGYRASLNNVGFCQSTFEGEPGKRHRKANRIYNAHNLPTDKKLFVPWVGRLNDDTINAVNTWRLGGAEISLKYVQMVMMPTQQENGGLTDIYQNVGTVRKTAYAILAAPGCTTLVEKFGRYHHRINWRFLTPKLISDSYRKEV